MTTIHRSDPMTDKLREALAFYGNMQNWQDGGFTRTARNTMTLIMSTAMKDRGERARAALAAAPAPAPALTYSEALRDVLRDFREYVFDGIEKGTIMRGGEHHNPIWARVADALAAAPQPEDEWPDIPDTPEERAYRKGWNEGITAGHKLVPVDDPAAPQPASDREVEEAFLSLCEAIGVPATKFAAQEYRARAVTDREALLGAIEEALREWGAYGWLRTGTTGFIADALLARGLRLAGDETMAWAVVSIDGQIMRVSRDGRELAEKFAGPGDSVKSIAIRVVEGGDDDA